MPVVPPRLPRPRQTDAPYRTTRKDDSPDMLNHVILIGNLGRDPELRTTQSGQTVANLRLATSRRWTDRDGNRQDETEWHTIVCWGRQAEVAGQYLTRGKLVSVEGRLQTRSWEDKQTGQKRYATEIVCRNFQMLGGRGDSGGQPGQGQSPSTPAEPAPQDAGFDPAGGDDDIPF